MKRLLSALLLSFTAPALGAQDFYDTTVLRTVNLDFQDENWWQLLKQNWASQTNILADLTVEGVTYPDVGVRIRGNTSYIALPPDAEKVSLNVTVDFVHPGQDVMGYESLNFNNAFLDPTFCREVAFHNIARQWIPAGRANHVIVTLEGENWGVYANIQQYNKKMLEEFFEDADGMRVKCANDPTGPGLQYEGPDPASYAEYEIKDDGGLADPVAEIIAVCDALDNTPPADWASVDEVFAVDPSIWAVVMENLYSDDDSYLNKGCDFVMYRNPVDGRMHLHQTDANETWTDEAWDADYNFGASTKPFVNNVLSEPSLRGRYYAHFREALEQLKWSEVQAEILGYRDLIDAAVQADPKKLYSYQAFRDNFITSVPLDGAGPFGGSVVGLREYVTQRRAHLLADPEVAADPPVIEAVGASSDEPGVPVFVTATVTAADGVASVELWYQADPSAPYESEPMLDDGLSGDGAAGDGVFGVELPVVGVGGQKLAYYVGATAQNTFSAQSFSPARAEMDPRVIAFQGGVVPSDIVINEFLAQNNTTIQDPFGSFEDYVELYNKGTSTVDLSGMYMSDSLAEPTEWAIPAGTTLAPGETILFWADEDLLEGPLHADFKLSASGEDIGLWDTDGVTLLDSVSFGPQVSDVSTGRLEDGGSLMVTFSTPTPGTPNKAGCGIREYDRLDPLAHTLSLSATGSGSLGTDIVLEASGFLPNSTGFFALGFTPIHLAVDGTDLVGLVQPSLLVGVPVSSTGTLTVPVYIIDSGALVGLDGYFQVAGADALGALSASNAVNLTICP